MDTHTQSWISFLVRQNVISTEIIPGIQWLDGEFQGSNEDLRKRTNWVVLSQNFKQKHGLHSNLKTTRTPAPLASFLEASLGCKLPQSQLVTRRKPVPSHWQHLATCLASVCDDEHLEIFSRQSRCQHVLGDAVWPFLCCPRFASPSLRFDMDTSRDCLQVSFSFYSRPKSQMLQWLWCEYLRACLAATRKYYRYDLFLTLQTTKPRSREQHILGVIWCFLSERPLRPMSHFLNTSHTSTYVAGLTMV